MNTSGKIVIAGGTGALGKSLVQFLKAKNYEVVVLTRSVPEKDPDCTYVYWDGRNPGEWCSQLEKSVAVINLSGKSVNCRYTEENKRAIIASRVESTEAIGNAIRNCSFPPAVWINAGSAAIFGDAGETFKYEGDKPADGFSPEVCKRWEKAFFQAATPETRKVVLRIGMVLQKEGGVLQPLLNLVKYGMVTKVGSGNQYLTWIHIEDFCKMILMSIENTAMEGVIHCASPSPATNKDFIKVIRNVLGLRIGFPMPEWVARMGCAMIGTEPELILFGRRVVSSKLDTSGFTFSWPELEPALKNLLKDKN